MSSSYPGALDSFTNPSPSDPLSSPSHSGLHSDVADAVEALEAKVGTGAFATPTVFAVGAAASGTGALTVDLPAGHTTDDILVLVVQTSNEDVSGPDDYGYAKAGPFVGFGDAPAAGSTRLSVFWLRDDGAQDPTMGVDDSGNHTIAAIVGLRGCHNVGDPFRSAGQRRKTTASTTGTGSAGSTPIDNCLVLDFFAHALDSASAVFSAPTNADLTGMTERLDVATASGFGGGIGVFSGAKTLAGDFRATTVTETSTADVSSTLIFLPLHNTRGPLGGVDRQVFLTTGLGFTVTDTWAKPTGAKDVEMTGVGGGASGGSGRNAATASGGGGGGGGEWLQVRLGATQLPATMNVVPGNGGAATTNADNATQHAGGGTIVAWSSNAFRFDVAGGSVGLDGASNSGGAGGPGGGQTTIGTPAAGSTIDYYGCEPARGGTGGTTGTGGSHNQDFGGGGGGGGGTIQSGFPGGNSRRGGGGGGGGRSNTNFGAGGQGGAEHAGGASVGESAPDAYPDFGAGGGAGGSSTTHAGNGGWPGGGGGGGGSASGAQGGGAGGDGVVVITTFF